VKPKALVLIEWEDAAHQDGWQGGFDVCTDPVKVSSIGFIMAKTKTQIVLAMSVASDNCAHTLQIPRAMIKKIYMLKRTA
jgi:hypothetical protein